MPLVLLLLVVLHLAALHEVGSNNPEGVDIKKKDENGKPLDGIRFIRTTPSKTSLESGSS